MEQVNQEIQAVMGNQVSGMHCMSRVDNMPERQSERIYLFENRGDPIDWDGRWCSKQDLGHMTFLIPEQRTMAQQALEEIEGLSDPDLRPPWSIPGWFDQATAWFKEELDKSEIELVHPIQCIYSWPVSAVLHAETSSGEIYMKAASQLRVFVDEPLLTSFLASLFPNRVPTPMCVEPEHRWMLLPDLGYPIREATEEEKVQALLAFGELQRRSIKHADELLRMGCPDRRLDKLEGHIESLTLHKGVDVGLSDDELARLPLAGAELMRIARRLANYNIPYTLGHGDLHLGNVARCDGEYVFFDWGQACVSHPFLDAWFFVQESEAKEMPEVEYLALWREYESEDRLREALALAKPLCSLNETIDQHHILRNFKPEPEELPNSLAGGLRAILESTSYLPCS